MEADEESEEALKQIAAASTRLLQGSEADFSCFENLLQFSTSHVLQVIKLMPAKSNSVPSTCLVPLTSVIRIKI